MPEIIENCAAVSETKYVEIDTKMHDVTTMCSSKYQIVKVRPGGSEVKPVTFT